MCESNEALYSLIKMGGADFDVIVPSDYMIARLIQEDMLAELDYAAIPNFQLMDPQFTHLSFDPENKYTVPYTWGSVGIIYNTTMVDEPVADVTHLEPFQYAVFLTDRHQVSQYLARMAEISQTVVCCDVCRGVFDDYVVW